MHQKQEIINRLLIKTAEVITPEEFTERVNSGQTLTHYIGFEISGYVHIGQGITSALVIKDLQELGVKCIVWLADWHTAMNNKLDGSKETAAVVAQGYFTEAIKACLLAVGADVEKVEFRLASEWYKQVGNYWETVMAVAQHTTIARGLRSISIMGKEAGEEASISTLLYPVMQVADIFSQSIDIAHAGMDQRKAHVVMRDVAEKIMPGKPKPVALHNVLIDSLTGDAKMSKSKPDSAVFIHDEPKDIERKITKAFCEEKNIAKNPILNWTKHLLFWNRQKPFVIERKPEHGGNIEFESYEDLEKAFSVGEIHPMDLKTAVAKEIIELLGPAREHFANPNNASKKAELDKVLKKN